MHLAQKVHVTSGSRVNAFILYEEMFEQSFKLVSLPYNG